MATTLKKYLPGKPKTTQSKIPLPSFLLILFDKKIIIQGQKLK
jgi:hypothetical protein